MKEKEASPANSQARLLGADKPAVVATDALIPRRPEEEDSEDRDDVILSLDEDLA